MIRNVFITGTTIAGLMGLFLLAVTIDCHAENWIKNDVDIPNKNVESVYYDSDSVKVQEKTLSWTEKVVMTSFGEKAYTKHLSQYPECQNNIAKKGNVTQYQLDFEIKGGKYRFIAKRNYSRANEIMCIDKDMGNDLDKSWKDIQPRSPMEERYYNFVTKYKLGNM